MIRDTFTLALTKLRTRKIRLSITIIVSGLLFTGLVGASMIARGAFSSIAHFSDEGFGKRYIVAGSNTEQSGAAFGDPTVIARATTLHNELVARKKAEAKRLDITYDAATELPAVEEFNSPSGKQRTLNFQSPIAPQVLQEYNVAHPGASEADFSKSAAPYKPQASYTQLTFPYTTEGRLHVLKDGKETFSHMGQNQGPPQGLDSFPSTWSLMDRQLLDPFILEGQNLQRGANGSLPVIVPQSAAEQLSGFRPLPSTASSQQRLARTKELRAKAKTVTFTLCYRNQTSAGYIESAIAAEQEVAANKNKKDYRKPDLMYGLPNEACAPAPIIRDVRTPAQKKQAAKQEEFDRIFGIPNSIQSTFTFRLVGIVPDPPQAAATNVTQVIGSLITSSLGTGWFSPREEILQEPTLKSFFENTKAQALGQRPTYFVEFATSAQAHDFIDQQSCSPDFSVLNGANIENKQPDPYQACKDAGKPFSLQSFGSNSLALDKLRQQFNKFFTLAALGVAFIAAIIMMGTVGRLIADSRRETAVFRAIGAKRFDIAQIYLLYTLLLSLMISGFAILGGTIAAILAQHYLAAGVTTQALVAYNAQDLDQNFRLYHFHLPDILLLIGVAAAIGLLSITIPLIRNVRRNPIRDMRDDT